MDTFAGMPAGRGLASSRRPKAGLAGAATAALLLTCAPSALHAETNAELAAEIKALKEQIREMRGLMTETRSETRRTAAKVRAAATRTPAPVAVAAPAAVPVGYPAIPAGSTPAFVTADKRLQFGAITITPGGFLAGESIYRTRTINSDIGTQFGAVPFGNSPLAHVGEFRPSARQTRLALLAEGAITPNFFAAGYVEMDFFSAANTANYNQTNSFNPRIRHLYATLDNNDYGMHVLAGQNWSLLTLNSKGITPRNEVTPTVIDNNQTVGSIYARQPQIRLVKDFGRKLWVGISAEAAESTFGTACNTQVGGINGAAGTATPNPANGGITSPNGTFNSITCGVSGVGGNSPQVVNSLNRLPDIVGKMAYEANVAGRDIHLEAMGVLTEEFDRVTFTPTAAAGATGPNYAQINNKYTKGWGVGGGLIAPVVPKRVDFQINALYGRGIGRYGPTGIGETTFNPDGSLKAVPELIALTGVTLHATPSIDIYAYAGVEMTQRSYFQNNTTAAGAPGTFVGIGAPSIDNSGCLLEAPNAALAAAAAGNPAKTGGCGGSTKLTYEITGGVWDKIYKGSFGELRGGLQYAYLQRQLFNGTADGTAATRFLPATRTSEHMVFTSLRYYPFQ